MRDPSRVLDLVAEALEPHRTPEEVCTDFPELLLEVRARLDQVQSIEAQLESLFPTKGPTGSTSERSAHLMGRFPQIPGYEIESILGRGGMGVVYRARHLKLDRAVALKMLLSGQYASALELSRFLREARAVAALQHASIVQIHDVNDFEGLPFYTMELVEGGSLGQKLRGRPLPPNEAAALVSTLAQAVHAAHQAGIVHRDLKPSNILLAADGTPKISDFGLARRNEGDPAILLTETKAGTPGYMSPEQANGSAEGFSPGVDVYSLGAILHELLTGRPPVRRSSDAQTQSALGSDEIDEAWRFDAKTPLDLETICLKCLSMSPERRYPTAAELADDLQRFLRGEPITARRVGPLERSIKWVRRRPSLTVALAASVLLILLLSGTVAWQRVQQSQRREAVRQDLVELSNLQERGRWPEAEEVLERAEARLGGIGLSDLRRLVGQTRRELELVMHLDNIRLSRVTGGALDYYKAKADHDYQEAFESAGLAKAHDDPKDVSQRLQKSKVRPALVGALDDWAVCASDVTERDWLLQVARHADPDPNGWRDRIRDPAIWTDTSALARLARTIPVTEASPSLLLALGERLDSTGGDATGFLMRVQQEHPEDFWSNLLLGNALLKPAPEQAGIYYRAALASRPSAAVGFSAVGDALRAQGSPEVAVEYFQKALKLDPRYARAHNNLGNAYRDLGRVSAAIDCYRRSIQLDPHYAWASFGLGIALKETGKLDEAIEQFQQSYAAQPSSAVFENAVRGVLVIKGRGDEVRFAWKKKLESGSQDYGAWTGYPELSLFLGDQQEYERACDAMLDRFGTTRDPSTAEGLARACLLVPPSPSRLEKAATLAERSVSDQALKSSMAFRYYLFAKGLSEYRQGHFDNAIAIMNGEATGAMEPCPRIIVAMAQHQQGHEGDALWSLAVAMNGYDWSAANADNRDVWIRHVLRREAEKLIVPQLPAFLAGTYSPRSNGERLAFVGACEFNNRYGACSRLYADTFAADPKLKDWLGWSAARAAAIAGCGRAADSQEFTPADRARWRAQVVEWLRGDLAAASRNPDRANPETRLQLKHRLQGWYVDPALIGLRESNDLQALPADEQAECLALWNAVDTEIKSLSR